MKGFIVTVCCFLLGMTVSAQNWKYVDPKIGSVGVGRTFPGPCMPFGMVKPGPDCGVLPNAGWAAMPEPVTGFSQTHVSGTGGGQKYGNICISPVTSLKEIGIRQHRVSETIELGYYSTTFENGIRTEITTSERCAHYRFHYPSPLTSHPSPLTPHLYIDATHFLGKDSIPNLRERQQFVGANIEIINNHEVQGYTSVRGGWNNGDAYTVYFALQTDVPFTAETNTQTATLQFADSIVNVKVGISYISTQQAHKNIDSIGFDEQLSQLREAWEGQLSKIQIKGTDTQKRMFYTALYHTLLMPVDKTGENPRWEDAPYYDDYYAIWDTYRTSSPLITLLDPQREEDIINSLLNIYRHEGYMPDARSGDCSGRTQGGSNAEVMIADAFVKKLDGIDYFFALEAMLKDGEIDPGVDHEKYGRGGLDEYKQLGYIPYGIDRAGNRTVEYAFNDYCIAQVAKGLGKTDIYNRYIRRSENWKNLWRSDYEFEGMRGFIMPRDANGQWLDSVPWGFRNSKFNIQKSTFNIPYTPTTKVSPWYLPWWSTFFYEATSEEYSLSIPHDVEGLIAACGGPTAFYKRLEQFFAHNYYNVQNEPSFLTPCLYHWLGMPNKSTRRIRQIINQHYSDTPDGLPGNDDSGAMSSWLAFHMMGLYPNAGTDYYLLNVPIVKEYTMMLANGHQLHVSRKGNGFDYVRATLNGHELSNARITHDQLMEGGELVFETRVGELLPPPNPKLIKKSFIEPVTPTMSIHYTLNRQFRTWPLGCEWRGDTLVLRCKDTHYIIPRQVVDGTDVFCWLNPQIDGTVHDKVNGTYAFISPAALRSLKKHGMMTYDTFTWRRVDENDSTIHVRSDIYEAEMWIDKRGDLPWVLEMKNNPLGIDWKITRHFIPERTGGVYYAYPVTSTSKVHVPDGFEVFYISHYGRHGSRWLPDEDRYKWVNAQFKDDANLTPFGKSVKKRLQKVWNNAKGNAGQLTPLGMRQHQGIAHRMAERFPSAFQGNDTKIQARSSIVPRCRASMLAFCGELSKEYPQLTIRPETDALFMSYINHESAELKAFTKGMRRLPQVSPNRFLSALFNNPAEIKEPLKLMSELHTIASDMQDIPLDISLWDCFTVEEMQAVHDANNERMTLCNGDTPLNNGIPARSSIALWQNIEQETDEMLANDGHGASLRFGHDTALYRLLTLMQLSRPGDGMEDFLPMAANLQMVFCKNKVGQILVGFLLNEEPCRMLHVPSTEGYFYAWTDVKAHMKRRIHELEHLRQLSAINTMVGTAPANTKTAGLFGKGSEEHGQTLPAVLTPNGQTFWTPQTRDTEKKCVAPYYYTDSLFQGIRASHWLVGGCTQDYGSFTIAALTGKLRLQREERATPFSHQQEVSHPYYYKVRLPEERLTMELTGLSHSAIIRVTPEKDGPVHIVINTNSDELEGAISLDTKQRLVYGNNPVHRIYQGWGERAGFSGHLALTYTDEIVSFKQGEQTICLTFKGRKGQPLILKAATSFTGKEGALANLAAEANQSFEEMEQVAIGQWIERIHTIDIEDADTAKVNQFYGAFYRTSFLPREMSDVDGSRPRFADGAAIENRKSVNRKSYGDFSMWDTYRALHPLYNLIVPDVSADMMQSLVEMYKEGGWLPIFPCWNSYTAAMIGDHCTSVLADAYVKGIRNFDVETAYEAMRKNAMESPKTFEDYKNGMGRRALKSYIEYGYIPMEDSVKEAFHTNEQTSRTLEYAYDDFCVAQLAKASGKDDDYRMLMARSENWRNVINPSLGYADGRHADGTWENNTDLVHRKSYITEGATCHYTWYVPHNVEGLIKVMGGREAFVAKLDSMFTEGRYWHGNEPCHQVPWLFSLAGAPEKTRHWVHHILETEYNDTPGGLSGNDDAGQMSAWQMFAMMGFYPVCPATDKYARSEPVFRRITINQPDGRQRVIADDGRLIFE